MKTSRKIRQMDVKNPRRPMYLGWETIESVRQWIIFFTIWCERSVYYHDQVVESMSEWVSRLLVQTNVHEFHHMNLISQIEFLHIFRRACDNILVHGGTNIWLSTYFMRNSAATAWKAYLSLKTKSSHYSLKGTVLTTCCQVVNILLEI